MPGVCILPGLKPRFNSASLGIPGVLPEAGGTALTEIPGGMLADIWTGFPERPGGIFAGSSLISLPTMELPSAFEFEAATEFEVDAVFDGTLEPQPKLAVMIVEKIMISAFLDIKNWS